MTLPIREIYGPGVRFDLRWAISALTLTRLAAIEWSKTPFYVAGGALVAWGVVSAVVGLVRSDFPRGNGALGVRGHPHGTLDAWRSGDRAGLRRWSVARVRTRAFAGAIAIGTLLRAVPYAILGQGLSSGSIKTSLIAGGSVALGAVSAGMLMRQMRRVDAAAA